MGKAIEKKAIATVDNSTVNNATVDKATTNNKKVNANVMLALTDFTTVLQKAIVGSKCKVFTDSKFYAGFGVTCNGFSVNVKKSKYNIYCNETNAKLVEKIDGVKVVRNGNATDKTRPHYIELKSTELLMQCINTILDGAYRVATDTK